MRSLSRSIACSCTAGATAGAANDGDNTATRSPGDALTGTRNDMHRV
ncbi:hypothetical protein HMPREF9997_01476 [Corynebacterium durum F0235]|uniref:Uncharacterized protein n=1 Tax=Corynebacterium durum F0235 TaxID=1035195 RepID=L1MH58_9CORY|nr:hypothetical protein HMPREF9997_01476 [Corynebacterium durum F0235]